MKYRSLLPTRLTSLLFAVGGALALTGCDQAAPDGATTAATETAAAPAAAPAPAAPAATTPGAGKAMVPGETPTVESGGTINPSSVGPRDTLLSGWEEVPNDIASWTVGTSAKVGFNVACQPGEGLAVTVTNANWIGPFVPKDGLPMHVDLKLNDQKIGEADLPASGLVIKGVAPASAVKCGDKNILEIAIPAPRRPSDGDPANTDKRLLGLAVSGIKIEVTKAPS